jgi:hypothetical protein
MQVAKESPNCRWSVVMIRRRNDDCVQVFLLEQLTVVGVGLCLGVKFRGPAKASAIDIAQRDDRFRAHSLQVARPATTNANHANVQFLVRPKCRSWNEIRSYHGGRGNLQR